MTLEKPENEQQIFGNSVNILLFLNKTHVLNKTSINVFKITSSCDSGIDRV